MDISVQFVPRIPEQVVPKVIWRQVDFGSSCAISVSFYSESLCKNAQNLARIIRNTYL